MPNRILREGILTSVRVCQLSWPAEVFYRRLMSVVDDFGRYYAEQGMLRAACFPRQLGKVSDSDIGKWLEETRKAGLVRVFESGGEAYLELLDFRQQVRAKQSRFPDGCTADATQMHSSRAANAHLDVDVSVGVAEIAPSQSSPPVAELPLVNGSEYGITQEMLAEWTKAFPAVDVPQQLREMRAWCLANPAKRKTAGGIARFIVAWLSKEQDRGGSRPAPVDPPWKGAK